MERRAVRQGEGTSVDTAILRIINGLSGHMKFFDIAMRVITKYGYLLYVVYGIVRWFAPDSKTQRTVNGRKSLLYAFFAVIIGSVISWIWGAVWFRNRPFVTLPEDIHPLISYGESASFPSSHSALSLSVALRLFIDGLPKAGWLIGWSMVIAFSRLYAGLHYPSDILGGFALAFISNCLVVRIAKVRRLVNFIYGTWETIVGVFLFLRTHRNGRHH